MNTLSYIIWNFDPTLINLFDKFPVRWYGLFFALGFLLSQQVMFYIHKKEAGTDLEKQKLSEKYVESITIYMIIATIVGARLGHVLFYQPMDYLSNPLRILNLREGGLASHGGGLAIFFSLWLFSKYRFNIKDGAIKNFFFIKFKRGYSYPQILDRVAIVVALVGVLIRFGNFTNSEIIGKPTNSDWGVVFAHQATDALTYDPTGNGWIEEVAYRKDESRTVTDGHVPVLVDITFKEKPFEQKNVESFLSSGINRVFAREADYFYEPLEHPLEFTLTQQKGQYIATVSTFGVARHPSQLYESFSYLLIFLLLFSVWNKRKTKTPPGLIFGLLMTIMFIVRFSIEFTKENQVAFEDGMTLNMGQWLSIPFVLAGIGMIVYSLKNKNALE
ncbi:MAG: prolipoprotein diacylglyceryl transferase [Cyclobacteriaceae bacterium]|nr:prolipoprotein diacylglyceryl transferase [Cyclobacteriaceae bacterium]